MISNSLVFIFVFVWQKTLDTLKCTLVVFGLQWVSWNLVQILCLTPKNLFEIKFYIFLDKSQIYFRKILVKFSLFLVNFRKINHLVALNSNSLLLCKRPKRRIPVCSTACVYLKPVWGVRSRSQLCATT